MYLLLCADIIIVIVFLNKVLINLPEYEILSNQPQILRIKLKEVWNVVDFFLISCKNCHMSD